MDVMLAIAGLLGSMIGVISVFLAYKSVRYLADQVDIARVAAKGQFISNLEQEIVSQYNTYANLLPSGTWSLKESGTWASTGVGPQTSVEVSQIIAYLGFFAKIKFLIDTKAIDFPTIDRMFAFRFFLVVHNRHVQERILYSNQYGDYWSAIFVLHQEWTEHRQKQGCDIPWAENSLDSYKKGSDCYLQYIRKFKANYPKGLVRELDIP